MRLWTVHPRYLDPQGLVALWREALLAQKVLQGRTKGYRHHPQLCRFRAVPEPEGAIASYLLAVCREAHRRGYHFDVSKIGSGRLAGKLPESKGQLLYEWQHLRRKLRRRSRGWYERLRTVETPDPHPLFRITAGGVQAWERQ